VLLCAFTVSLVSNIASLVHVTFFLMNSAPCIVRCSSQTSIHLQGSLCFKLFCVILNVGSAGYQCSKFMEGSTCLVVGHTFRNLPTKTAVTCTEFLFPTISGEKIRVFHKECYPLPGMENADLGKSVYCRCTYN